MQKATAANVHFVLGMTDAVLDVVPVRKAKVKTKTHLTGICPACEEPTKPEQKYRCPRCELLMAPGERDKAKEIDGLLFRFTDEEVAAIKEVDDTDETPVKTMFISVCPKDELLARTRPDDTAYRLRMPRKGKHRVFYDMLGHAAASDYGLYGLLRLSEGDPAKPFRLEVWNNQIVLQSIIRPQDLGECDDEIGSPGKYREMADMVLAKLCEPLREDRLDTGKADLIEQIVASKDVREAVVTPLAIEEEDDLLTALAASLEAVKATAA